MQLIILTTLLCLHVTSHVTADQELHQDVDQIAPAHARLTRSPKYMRFGRSLDIEESDSDDSLADESAPLYDEDDELDTVKRESIFPRIGGGKRNFPRFGRSFPRFGKRRTYPRFGKRDTPEHWLRFGRGLVSDEDLDAMIKRKDARIRFGKRMDARIRFGKRQRDARIRFGKRQPDARIRFGKKADPMIFYGKRNVQNDDGEDVVQVDELSRVARSANKGQSSVSDSATRR